MKYFITLILLFFIPLPLLSNERPVWKAHRYFGDGKYDQALKLYKDIRSKGDNSVFIKHMIETVKHRKSLGEIRPDYTQHIGIIFVREIRAVGEDGSTTKMTDVTNNLKRRAEIYQNMLKQVIESFSNGKLSLSFEHMDAISYQKKGIKLNVSNADTFKLGDFFFENINRFDTFFTLSVTQSPGWGLAAPRPYINRVIYSQGRGMTALNAERHGFMVWLHEYFHSIEWMSIGGPAHAFRKNLRHHFPKWKGETEFDYYRWRFNHAEDRKQFWKYVGNCRHRWPRQVSPLSFEIMKRAYRNIPFEKRDRAKELYKKANKHYNRDRTKSAALYKEALELSPYLPNALQRLARHYQNKVRNLDKALFYYRKFAHTISPGDGAMLIGRLYKQFNKKKEADLHFEKAKQYYVAQLKEHPLDLKALHGLGTYFFDIEEKKRLAIPLYKTILLLTPFQRDNYCRLGQAYLDDGKVDEAIQQFDIALNRKLKPTDVQWRRWAYRRCLFWKGYALGEYLGQYKKAYELVSESRKRGNISGICKRYLRKYTFINENADKNYHYIGEWTQDQLTKNKNIFTWDVSRYVKRSGNYEVVYLYTHGWKAIDIFWTALRENGKEIHRDGHKGFSGNRKRNHIYTLSLRRRMSGAEYTISAKIKGNGGDASNGMVFIRKR